MADLNAMYDEQEGTQENEIFNNFPSGLYNVRLRCVSLETSKKGSEYIKVTGEVEGGEYSGEKMSSLFFFPDDKIDIAKKNMNRFKALNNLVGCKFPPETLTNPVAQDWYSGIVLKCNLVKKPNLKDPKKDEFCNWYFNEIVKGKDASATTPEPERSAPPSKPPKSVKPKGEGDDEEIDLDDDDPFKTQQF